MSLFTVRRGIAVVGIAGAAAAVALTVPALVTAQSVSPISSVTLTGHPGTVLADGPGDPNTGTRGPGDPSAGQGGGPSNPGAGGGAGDPTMGHG
ncbi:hypothetical protein OG203_17615 [Nocardia sp. NBC_01499]|uniref:hypothetical protein n=1 Tax=Nocardia sp. NBC_01499 TaxID=2903597 RepID=UPI00386D5FFA